MNFKTFVLSCLLFFSPVTIAATEDVFRVAPYTLKHTNGNLLLNFQTTEDQGLIIEDNGEAKYSFLYKKNEHYKVELKKVPCGAVKEIKILDAGSRDVLYQNTQPPAPCHNLTSHEPFVFGFISDTQQFRDRHEDIAKVIAHHQSLEPMQFLINGGDIVQEGDAEQEWLNYFEGGKAYLMDIPQIAAIGNHDYRGNSGNSLPRFFQQFMRWEGSDKSGNLFFDFPEMQLLILNSNFTKLSNQEEHQTWKLIEEKMKASQKLKKPLIVATHFPAFSSSLNRFSSLPVMKMRNRLVPLVEKYKIPLVLSGHTHMYERSFKDGIHYLVAGPAGGRVNKPTFKNKYLKFLDFNSLTFTKIKLDRRIFSLETYNQENKMIDSVVINLDRVH